MRIGPQT
ncbi:rCG57541 [Rattus norvegicus]|nr:rCG57541 [Rattus norvegicus]